MKKILFLLIIIIGVHSYATYEESDYDPYYTKNKDESLNLYAGNYSGQPGNIGVGLNLGTNDSLNIVYQNLVVNVSFESLPLISNGSVMPSEIDMTLDLIFRSQSTDQLALPLYYGAGVKFQSESDENLGIRGVVGIGAFLTNVDENLEVFAELTPTFYLPADNSSPLEFEFGIGTRYYF